MEQTIPFSAMKGNVERAVETKNQHLGTKLTRRARYLMAALLISLAGVSAAQAQCNYTESDFDVTFEDGNNLEIYEGITINYIGANVEPDSIQLLITTGSEWKDTVTAFRDDDWFIQLGPLDKGQYYVKMLPFSNGQECYWLTSASWVFNITCSPENASPVFDYINIIPPCDGGDTYSIIVGSSLDCGTGEDIEVYLDDQYISGDPAGYGSEVTLELDVVGEHTISLVYPTNSSQVDTTISVGTACLMTTDYGRNSWSINDYAYDPNDQQFFFDYHAYITGDWDGDLSTSIQIEVQYKRVEDNEWLSITKYYDGYDNIIEVPITAKGTWQARSRVICCDGSGQGPWSDTLTRPVYFYTDGNWTTPIVTGICGNNTGSIRVSPMTLDNAAPFYYLLDSNNDTIAGPVVASNGYVYFDGITAAGTYTIRAFVNIPTYGYFPTPYDTTMVVLDGNACDISITDYSGWNVDPLVNKFMFRDPNNPDTFYFSQQYNCSTPYEQSNSVSSYEIQYKLTTDSEWQTITSTTGQDVYIPITSKGTWMSRSRAICCEGHAGPWSDTTYSPIYFYFGPQAGSTITITPVSCDGAGGFSMDASTAEQLYFADQTNPFYYYLFDENDNLVTNQMQANRSTISYNNITTPGTYRLALLFQNDSDPNSAYEAVFDTTFTITAVTSCDITATGTPSLTILDYSYEDYENSGNFGEFYYRLEIPSVDGTPESIEVQYGLVGSDSPSSVYYNPSTGAGSIKIPITAKGDWEVKMRARCCGGSFPGNIPGDWFLIDTIHHYPNFAISTEGYCYRIPPAQSENGSATINFNPPYNVSSNTSEMRVRIFPVDNSSDIKYDGSGTSGAIELADLSEGDYKVYVYINDGTDENTFNAYLDTSFSIGYRFKIAIQNDSSSICATDSVLYRAIVTGGNPPYEYEWDAYETTFGQFDDSVWVNFDIASSVDPGVAITDADGCFLETAIHVNLLPAYNQETDYYYDNYEYSLNSFHVPQNLCPLTRFGVTYNCGSDSTMDVHYQTADGCDSIQGVIFTTQNFTGIPGGGTLDTTISYGIDLTLTDDGGGDGYYTLNSHGTAIIRAAGGERDKLIVDVYNGGALSIEDTLLIYKGDVTEIYRREGTWNQPGSESRFIISGGVVTVHFNTGSLRGEDAGGYWKGHRMEQVGIWTKSPDQLTITPVCNGTGSVQVTNSAMGVYYCLTNNSTNHTDTIFCGSSSEEVLFSNLTDPGSYTLHSYIKNNGIYESTDHDTTFTVPAGSFELSVSGDSATVCSVNPSVTLTANVTGGQAPYAYSWSDGSTETSTTVTEAYATPTVTVTDNSGCSITYATNLSWIDYVESDEAEEASVCESATTYTWNSTSVTIDDEHLGDGYYIYYDTVESAGTCPTITELHLTVKPNATIEEHVLAWGTSYTWAVDGNSYTTSLGSYYDTVDGCPVAVEYNADAATATHTGVAANGCDSIYTLNLTLIDGIPIPATGTTDTTLATMVEGDTVWVYDNGGMMGNYSLNQNGMLVLRAPEGYTLQVVSKEFSAGDGDRVNLYATERDAQYYTYDYFDNNGGMSHYDYFHNNGTPSGRPYVSVSRNLYMKFAISDSVVGQGFKLAVTLKSLDDTCLAVYDVDVFEGANMYEKLITWRHEGSTEGYHVFIGCSNDDVYFDTIVTDTFFVANHEWISPSGYYNFLKLWAVCGDGDTSAIHSESLTDQCGFRPGLADGEMYNAPATMSWSEPSNNNFELYGQMPPCWSRGAGSYTRPDTNLTYPMLDDVFGGDANWMALYFYTNADVDQYAAMPKFDTTYGAMNTWALNFTLELADYNHGTECEDEPVVLYVGVMDNYLYGSTFTAVDSIFVNRNDYTDEANKDYYVSLAGYNGSGLYPAFKMARRSMHNENDYANPTLMLYDVMVVPDGGLKAPTNVTVADLPTQEGKGIISWTAPAWPSYDDDYSTSYVIELTNTSGSTFSLTADYDATSSTFDATAGEQYKIKLYYKVTSARYSSSWMITDGNTYRYERPLYEHLTVDTIGDLSDERLYSYVMPFEYGNESSSEILIESTEIDATAIDAIAFRMPPQSCIPETSFQRLQIYMKDVTLTELDAQNMTDDYLFDGNDLVVLDTTTTGGADGWLTFTLNQTYTHDPDKNILIGIASWPGDYAEYYGGYTKFYMEDNVNQGMALWFEGASDLTEMPSSHEQYNRPQMKLIGKNNCTNDTLVVDTNLCENASLDWRGMTISFSDPDIESHMVQISTYNYIYVYTDKVEEVTASGCDSIYKLQITKRYNEDNNYDIENYTYPHVTSCGPYTWQNGVTYDYSMGTYSYNNGGCTAYGSYGPRAYDTVPGVTAYGCDSIYGLNLTIDPWYTVVFDTTGVDAGTGMEPVYRCDGSDYTLPECTMTVAYKRFVRWEIDGEEWYPDEDYPYDDLSGDTLYLTPVFECPASVDTTVYADFCPNGDYYTWRGEIITTAYAIAHGHETTINGVEAIEFRDTIFYAVGSVCDSVYLLQMIMDNKLVLYEETTCDNGYTWIDGNTYTGDFGFEWVYYDEDGYKDFVMSTAATYLDSTANDGCGTLHMLSVENENWGNDDFATDTIYFINHYTENVTELDTIDELTLYVCDNLNYYYVLPKLPETESREGYDFVGWSNTPDNGDTVAIYTSEQVTGNEVWYGIWKSNCENKEVWDTTLICINDTVEWHGFTWNGPELEFGEWDTVMTKYGVIPGECDSIFYLHVNVPDVPMLSVTGREDPLCYGNQDGWISVAVDDGNAPFQYALGDSSYTAALDTTGYKFENLSSGSHTVWVKDACGVTDYVQVNITAPNELTVYVDSYTDSAVCYGAGKQLNAEVSGGTGIYTYMWNNDTNRTNDTLLVNTSIAGTRTDTVLVTDGNGCTAIGSYTTLVYDTMTVTVNGGDTTYCYGATAVPLTVTVTGGDTNSGYTYTWYDYNQETVQGESITVPTNVAATYSQMGVTVSNSCGTKQLTVPTITVLDSLRMWPQVDDVRLCYGANIGQIEVNVQGGGAFTGEWYMNGTAVTDHNPGDAGNKYTPRTDTVGTFAYSLKVTSNAGCGSDSALVKYLTVYDTLVVTATDQSATYCVNAEADTLRATIVSGSGNYTLQWRRNGSAIADASDTYYVPETTDAGDTSVYTFSVTDNEGCGDTVVTVATIVMRNAFDVTPEDQSDIYCLNSTPDTLTLEGQISGSGSYSYQWYAVTGDTVETIDTLAGATNIWYVPATNVAGEYQYRVKVTDLACGDTTVRVADITVMDSIRITSGVDSLYACLGGNAGQFSATYTGGGGEADYIWYLDGVQMQRDVDNTYTPSTDSAGEFKYYLMIRTSFGCASDSVLAGVLTVTSPISLTVDAQDTTYCYGATAEPITINATGGNGEYHYSWLVADNDDFMMGETLAIDTNSYTPATDTNRSYYFRVTVTSGACSASRDINSIYVMPQVKLHVTTDTNTICYGTEGNTYDLADVTEGGMGPYTYQWYKDGVEMDGETGDTYMPVGSAAGTFVYSAIAIDEAGCKSDTATVGVLTVSAQLQITSTHDTIIYCENSTANPLTVNVTGGVNYTYEWSIVSGNATLDSNNTSSTYTPSTDITSGYQDTTIYMVTVTEDECDQEASATIATVIVGANLSVAAPYVEYEGEELNNWAGINVCTNNSQKKLEAGWWSGAGMEGAPRPIGFQWYRDGVAIDGADTDTVIIATDSAGSFDYSVALVSSNGCGNDTLHTIVYIDDSLRYSGHLDVPTTLCLGSTVTEANQIQVNTTGGAGTFYYRWYIDGEPVADTATTSNVIMPSTDVAGTYSYSVQITANVCGSDSVHIMDLTVKAPTITYDTMAVCDSLRWINDSLYAIDTNNSSIYQGITTDQTHTVADQYGCDSTVYLHLTVNPSGYFYQGRGGMAPDTMSYCYGSWIDVYTDSQYPEGFAYQWYRDGEAIADATGWRDSTLADTPGTHVYSLRVTPYSGCASDSGAVRVANIYEPFAVNTFQLDTAGCMEDTYLNLPEVDTNATGGCGTSEMRWYEVVGNDTIESNGTVYMDSVGPGEHNYVLMLIDRYECGEGIGINATVTVAEDYTASFVSDEGSVPQSDTTMADLTVCSLNPGLELPENEYVYDMHTFIGWQNTATGDTLQPGDTVVLTGNTTFNTVWRANCQNVDTTQYIDMCFGDTTTWRGLTVTGAQEEYLDTVRGVVDVLCDSIYHLMVNVHYPSTSDTTILACDSIRWNDMFFTETPDTTQRYFMARADQWGCDSTAYLNLTVNYSIHDYVVETACDSYVFDSVTYTESTDLPTIGDIAENGCPFITHISLTVNYSYHGEDSATACDMYVWNDMELTEGGDHDFESFTVDGCDSIITLHLTLHNSSIGVDSLTACDSLSWIDGNTYFSDFTFDDQISYLMEGANQYGCDSTAVLYLTMQDHIYVEFLSDFGDGWMDEISACLMKPLVVPECAYVNEGFVFNGWTNQMDSMMVMPGDTLYLENSVSYYASWVPICEDVLIFTDTALCEGSSFTWRGQDFTNQLFSGDYEDVAYGVIENWCDSIYYLRLTVYPTSLNEFFDSVPGTYYWYDDEYTTSGVYERHTGVNRYGCDSTEVLHLVVYLGIDDKEEAIEVKVYPNPTSGLVNLDRVEIKKVSVVDMVGRTVATFTEQSQIDIRDLPAGNYTLFIETANGNTTRRIVKR